VEQLLSDGASPVYAPVGERALEEAVRRAHGALLMDCRNSAPRPSATPSQQVNDALGHEHGDRRIERCARLWANALRETDFIARIGDDEFFVLLPDCPGAEAEQIARRMLAAAPPGHSFSIGIAVWHRDEHGYEPVHRADRAMYAAKAGR
jgi:hypothetical protein